MLRETTTVSEVGYLNLNPKDPFFRFSLSFDPEGVLEWVRIRWDRAWCDGAKSVGTAMLAVSLLAALQASLPALAGLGGAKVPLLCALVICYALSHNTPMALGVAFAAGILQDSLSLTPLGLSSAIFGVVVLVVASFRDLVLHRSYFAQFVLGSIGIALAGAALFFVLSLSGAVICATGLATLRIVLASLVGGGLVVPLVHCLLHRLDKRLGDLPVEGLQDVAV